MATVLDILTNAARKAAILGDGDTMPADMHGTMLSEFNDMLHEWKLHSVDISHTDLDLTDTFPLGDEFRGGTVHLLASRVRPNYEQSASFDPRKFFQAIQAAYAYDNIPTSELPMSITRLPSSRRWLES